ncbi:unnamed protein product [Plutella xylostella]|uniref:(diamondback moth) hypothetical protein n=1 Tax=Plutella xylostella TaxID=51655 RepID=A0A8S4F0H4_PLUXY|nr:unnamed protein product [Plutella xylostella]
MAAVGPADPVLSGATPSGPPAALLALGPLHASEDAVAGAAECARFFPPGYSEPEHKPKQKIKKKKKKRESKEGAAEDQSQETPPTESGEQEAAGDEAGDGDGDEAGEGDGEGEEGDDAGGVDKATSPPPQT